MIQNLSAGTRRQLIQYRCIAMRGDVSGALRQIEESVAMMTGENVTLDQLSLLMLKAELLYLNCQEDEALEVFSSDITPHLSSSAQQISLIIGHNRNDVARSVFDSGSSREFYELYDQGQALGIKFWDAEAMVYAYEAAADGKHYDALPSFWRELVETYRQGSWRYFRHASERLVKECIQLGWLEDAAHHVINAQEVDLARIIGEHLLARRDPDLIKSVIQKLLADANLKRHARIACSLIEAVADGIPDDQVNEVLQWLLQRCSITPSTRSELSLVTAAWETLPALGPRLNSNQARDIIRTATRHGLWENPNHLRKYIIEAVNECVAVLAPEDLLPLAQQTIPLATTFKHDIDYRQAINLLAHIAQRGGDNAKATIGNALYPTEIVENAVLMQAAQFFGRQLAGEKEASRLAEQIAADVRKQVQILGPEDQGTRVAEAYGQISVQREEDTIVVSIYSFTGLEAVINHRELLSEDSLKLLVGAILSMISEPENVAANKVGLINSLIRLTDRLTLELASSVFETLTPIAVGNMDLPTIGSNADNPLNPFKMDTGKPSQVRGAALYALACVTERMPETYGERMNALIEQASTDLDPDIRRSAFTAARRVIALSTPVTMGLLLGTRDADPNTAYAAYAAFATKKDLHLTDTLWHQLVYSLTMACNSPNVQIRLVAAHTIVNLREQDANEDIRNKMQSLEAGLAGDVAYSVRSVVLREVATEIDGDSTTV